MKTCHLVIPVTYDDGVTDPESLASAVDRLLETALSTEGILDDYGNPNFGGVTVQPGMDELLEAFQAYIDRIGRRNVVLSMSEPGSDRQKRRLADSLLKIKAAFESRV